MADTRNVALVKRMYASKGDPAIANETLLASDLIWDLAPGFSFGGTHHGYQNVMSNFFGQLPTVFDAFRAEGEQYWESGEDVVVALGHYHGVTKKGRSVSSRFIHIWTIRDGKLAHLQQTADTMETD